MIAVGPKPRFNRLGKKDTTAPTKQGAQVRQMVMVMEGMEARLVEFLRSEMQIAREEMKSHMAAVEQKLEQQGEKMEDMQYAVEANHVNGLHWPSPARLGDGEEGSQWSSSAAFDNPDKLEFSRQGLER